MYISGGSNVYPREIEEVLSMHPAVAEVAIVGAPDATWGEVGIAVCVLREGLPSNEEQARAAEAAIAGWLESRIARYKQPRRFVFWDAMPTSGYGKVTKKLVKEKLAERGEI